MNEIYRIGRARVLRVRFFQWFMVLFGFGFLWWAWHLSQTYGLSPGDGGALRPAFQRYAWAAFLAPLGLACLFAARAYERRYVVRIDYDPKLRMVWIHTLDSRQLEAVSDLVSFAWHEGKTSTTRPDGTTLKVHAPWWELTVHGAKRGFIVDAQGATVDEPLLERLQSHR
jgi:hypothetical protein